MPPIQIKLDSPINAAKAASPTSSRQGSLLPATVTAASNGTAYTPAHPGAVATLATPSARPSSSPSPSPTRTTTLPQFNNPPPPQPGAVPTPPRQPSVSASRHSRNPSAASIGRNSVYAPANPFMNDPPLPMPAAVPMPPQFSIPPPHANHAATHSTSTPSFTNPAYKASVYDPPQTGSITPPQRSETSSPAYTYSNTPTTIIHPPGYQQDPNADAMPASARAAQAAHERRPSMLTNLAEAVGVSGGNDSTRFEAAPAGDEGPWGAAKKWMGGVADKAAQVEEEVWRRFSTSK